MSLSGISRILVLISAFPFIFQLCSALDVSVPPMPSTNNVVKPNFLGISLELSFMDEYFGNDTSTITPTIITYLTALRLRMGGQPLRLRIGGNSMDSSTYIPEQTSPMVQLTDPGANANNQPVKYGPMLWDVLKKVATDIGGAEYLIGLSLYDPNDPTVAVIAGAAQQKLGVDLDSFLLGNEPDLYTDHGHRPNLKNYTIINYIDDFQTSASRLTDTSAGNLLDLRNIGGPTVCCHWNLDALLKGGYLSTFDNVLKYISLQHYPQNNCFGGHAYELPYYLQHANVVKLAAWQKPGIDLILSNTSSNRPQLIMSEFNTASCGGIPNISNTFAAGSLWTIDYALQMAAAGYSAAYLHTRERGITYNLLSSPPGVDGNGGPWTTNPPYYALLVVAEALKSAGGSIVVDLNISRSMTDRQATVGGYAVYDAGDSSVQQIVLFNYANTTSTSETFSIPASAFTLGSKNDVVVKYLAASSIHEQVDISWGGQTLAGVGNGTLRGDATWATPDRHIDCTNGCSVDIPAPGLAVLFLNGVSDYNLTVGNGAAALKPLCTTLAKIAVGLILYLSL